MERGVDDTASYLTPGGGDAWAQAAQQSGRRGIQKLRNASRLANPPAWVVSALKLPTTAEVVTRQRTMFLDDQPVELTDSYYPLEIAADTPLELPGRIKGGAVKVLAELGYVADHADEAVELDAHPLGDEAQLLGIGPETRVVRIRRVVRTAAGAPFEAMEMVMIPTGRVLRHRVMV